ncbi:major facilitator superfamily transporter [Grosmannia clavigera kw1407]|uniref:Major facilitator superfamily transporter n=1 Tax=Grosmannia clavigera (strain kw1407 / UAMH 11150) TaxID=655863 RepID=F0X9L2_GROCL|nr:major facilitator superfamily transporter [Grosmannia clavigera kw1407]EFX05825.1 major facilitator superfamily transporter [Grosmannia clavigera kw1407]
MSADTKRPDVSVDDLAEPEDAAPSQGLLSLFRRQRSPIDLDAVATVRSVYDDPTLAPFYQPHADYENLHRFDVGARWTVREERRVRRKTDWLVLSWILIMFFALNLDRGNLSNAVADNLLDDIGATTDDYNTALNMYRIGFLVAEIPSQMVGKWLGVDRWIPVQIIVWSLASGGQFFMHSRGAFFACRFLIGLFMGGFIPDAVLYLSYFYTASEMPFRLALFWFVDSMSGVVASFIAYGALHLRGVHGRAGWRWLFLIEALITITIGFLSFLFLVPGPCETRTRWNPDGYYSDREETILVNRVLRDDPSKGGMHNREPITLRMLARSLADYDLWPIYAIGMLFEIPTAPPKAYLTLSLKALKRFNTFEVTLLGIPVTVFASINLLWISWLTEFFREICTIGVFSQLWTLPLLIVQYRCGEFLHHHPWGQYALTFVLLGWPSMHAAHVSWTSRLSNSVRTRAVGAALYNITIQLSGIASSNIYRTNDKPLYHRGNKELIAINAATIVAYVLAKLYYRFRNRQKSAIWDKMTSAERAAYLEQNEHLGNKRLDFHFDS